MSACRARHWSPVLSSWFADSVCRLRSNILDQPLCTHLPAAAKQHRQHQLICLSCSLLLQDC